MKNSNPKEVYFYPSFHNHSFDLLSLDFFCSSSLKCLLKIYRWILKTFFLSSCCRFENVNVSYLKNYWKSYLMNYLKIYFFFFLINEKLLFVGLFDLLLELNDLCSDCVRYIFIHEFTFCQLKS